MDKNGNYSKIERAWFNLFFKGFIDTMRDKPEADPYEVFKNRPENNRTFLRQLFGIKRLILSVDDGILSIQVGLEDRNQDYLIKENIDG